MNDEQRQLLLLGEHGPARFTPEQAAFRLGFNPHDIPILVHAKLLRPLGNPRKSAVKYFAAIEVNKLATNPQWLARATNAIYDYWHRKSLRRASQHYK